HCPAHGSTVPMLPIRDLLRSYLALGDGDSAEAVRHKVADHLLGLDPNLREALPLVLDLLGVPDPDAPDTSRASSGERLAAFVRRFVPLRSANEPVVLLIDDAHWIDPASEELVRELAAAVHGTRTLQAAAVMGVQFDEPLLEEVDPPGAHDLGTALGRLQEAEFIYLVTPYPQPQYAFKHPLTREVAYHSLLGDQRARLHAMVAAALEKLRADRLGQYASLIAHHWEASGMRYEATRWQRRAALQVSNIKVKSRR